MGNTRKKAPAKKKTAKKATKKKTTKKAAVIKPSDRKILGDAEATLRTVLESYDDRMRDAVEEERFTQDDMNAALLFDRLGQLTSEGKKLFNNAVLEAYDDGDGAVEFEPGRVVCNVNSTTRRTVPWKDECLKREECLRMLAQLAEEGDYAKIAEVLESHSKPFDRKKVEEALLDEQKPSITWKPKLTEGL